MSMNSKLSENVKTLTGVIPAVDVRTDLAYKSDYMNNSFFAIGHFDVKGHIINYLFHIMSYNIPGQEPVLASMFSITDETDVKYYADTKVYPLNEESVKEDIFSIKAPNGEMKGDIDLIHLHAKMEHAELNAELRPIGYPLFNGGTGLFHMVGMDIYQYSVPNVATHGTLTIDGESYVLDGTSWFDRQWQQKLPKMPSFANKAMNKAIQMMPKKEGGFELPTWGWMDLNMQNGDVLSVWFALEKKGEDCWATVMHPDGTQRKVTLNPVISQASDWWKSPDSAYSYPTKYKIQSPELDMYLTVTCVPKAQELIFPDVDMFNHYEGASKVEGIYNGKEMTGYCYTELIGKWEEK